jgi:hypothetical protein
MRRTHYAQSTRHSYCSTELGLCVRVCGCECVYVCGHLVISNLLCYIIFPLIDPLPAAIALI